MVQNSALHKLCDARMYSRFIMRIGGHLHVEQQLIIIVLAHQSLQDYAVSSAWYHTGVTTIIICTVYTQFKCVCRLHIWPAGRTNHVLMSEQEAMPRMLTGVQESCSTLVQIFITSSQCFICYTISNCVKMKNHILACSLKKSLAS